MLVFRGFHRPSPSATVLTLGNFDGVHRGHLALLERLRTVAGEHGLPASLVTFEPHPREFFAPASAPARLTTLREKLEHFAAAGVDRAYVAHFNQAFAALLPVTCTTINREQDLGDPGLRQAKLSYFPVGFVEKFKVLSSRLP